MSTIALSGCKVHGVQKELAGTYCSMQIKHRCFAPWPDIRSGCTRMHLLHTLPDRLVAATNTPID